MTISAGAGAVPGMSFTTDANEFHHAGADVIVEAAVDMRLVSGSVLGAVAASGVLIGTPASIQASAGGGIQLFAGAGIAPSLGSASGPGAPFGPSQPAAVNAGSTAESLNRLNDGIKGASDVVGGAMDLASAEGAFDRAKAAFDMAKGGWDVAKAGGAESSTADTAFAIGGMAFGSAGAVKSGFLDETPDFTNFITGTAAVTGQIMGMGTAGDQAARMKAAGDALGAAGAGGQATSSTGAAGGSLGAPSEGARIYEVAPASIDREAGTNMTCKVGGKKTALVDGKIEYTSGASIEMKAFSKVETSSLFFEAHANIAAAMKGLATAKVESFGSVTVEGKAKFKVASMGKGDIEASKINIKAKATLDVTSAKITIGSGPLTINSATTITSHVNMKKIVKIGGNFYLEGKAQIKGQVDVNAAINAKGDIKGNQTLKNPYFKAG
ncbi:MAG: hypothetical protein IT378_22560 [Sandaracinaceae bacterium]|nr:hypothetical protein [Sandaracinaceae bacterium]